MTKTITLQNEKLTVKEYRGQRVVTFADIERVHQRQKDIAGRNFRNNRERFIEGVDFYEVTKKDVAEKFTATYGFNKKSTEGHFAY